MKALIFLIVFAAVIALVVRKVRKDHAEAALKRRKAVERRKKKDSEALSQDTEIMWPVIIKPVTGKGAPGDGAPVEEPTMTSIEFEPTDVRTARQGGVR
jgi:hypothetical protein